MPRVEDTAGGGRGASVASAGEKPLGLRATARRNRLRARTVCVAGGAAVGVVLGVVLGVALGTTVGLIIGVAVAAVVAAALWSFATRAVLHLIAARPIPRGTQPRLENLVDGLCATFGLRHPRLMLVDDPLPNSCSLGTTQRAATLVVTRGLLDKFGLVEMEGVVAHELAHIRREDMVLSSVVTAVLGPWAWLRGDDGMLHRLLGRGREFLADSMAVAVVRYPPGLQKALEGFSGDVAAPSSFFAGRRVLAARWIWAHPVVGTGKPLPLLEEVDTVPVRATALAQL